MTPTLWTGRPGSFISMTTSASLQRPGPAKAELMYEWPATTLMLEMAGVAFTMDQVFVHEDGPAIFTEDKSFIR